MALVHNHSMPCSKSEMELFSVPPTQMVIEDSEYVEYRPFGGLNALGPIDFIIPGTGSKYLDINNTQLYIKAKLTKADGSDCEAANKVAPVNLLLHSQVFASGRGSQRQTHQRFDADLPLPCDDHKNPFRFQPFGVNYVALHVDEKQYPATPLTPNFTTQTALRSYLQLFSATGRLYGDGGMDITPSDFLDGYTLFAFDLTPDGSHGLNTTRFNKTRKSTHRSKV